jgi:hypothetical protein
MEPHRRATAYHGEPYEGVMVDGCEGRCGIGVAVEDVLHVLGPGSRDAVGEHHGVGRMGRPNRMAGHLDYHDQVG